MDSRSPKDVVPSAVSTTEVPSLLAALGRQDSISDRVPVDRPRALQPPGAIDDQRRVIWGTKHLSGGESPPFMALDDGAGVSLHGRLSFGFSIDMETAVAEGSALSLVSRGPLTQAGLLEFDPEMQLQPPRRDRLDAAGECEGAGDVETRQSDMKGESIMRKMTEREYEQFLEGRKAAGRKINPETAEVTMHKGDFYDPYNCAPEPPSDRDVGQGSYGPNWWVRDPNSDDGWVLLDDLPEATQQWLMEAIPAGTRLPVRMDRLLAQEWLAIQTAEGLKINPETAEVECYYEAEFEDGVYYPRLPEECRGIGREYFARAPGSDIWVSFQNLPKATRERLRAKLRRDYGREDHKECSNNLL